MYGEKGWQTVTSGNKRVLNDNNKPLGKQKICQRISSSPVIITNTFTPLDGLKCQYDGQF